MIRIGILGDIGSGKTYVAKSFGYPVFNADYEVGELKFDFLLRKYSITSKNILLDNKIQIEQIEGPFEFFKGEWIINKTKDLSAEIIFNSEFKLPFLLDNLLPDQAINIFCEGAMEAFIKRLERTEEG